MYLYSNNIRCNDNMKSLLPGYVAEVDQYDTKEWFDILKQFDDANLYQTCSYDKVRNRWTSISNLVLRYRGAIVAVAQARIIKIPLMKFGIAYVRWGPLWKLHGKRNGLEIFSQAIRALRNEYSCRRGFVLRIYPAIYNDNPLDFSSCFISEGFSRIKRIEPERTLIVGLDPPIETLRAGLKQKWRNGLNRAERNELEILEGHEDGLFEKFIAIYDDMLDRKAFKESNDINRFRLIQKDLPDDFKMKIYLCRFRGELCAGAIFSAMGDTGVYLFGATNTHCMKSNGSYLIQWKFMEWLKENKFSYYDLNGINPESNPGTFRFKRGLCGRNGRDVKDAGQYVTYGSHLSSIFVQSALFLFAYRDKARNIIYKIGTPLKKMHASN